MDFIDIGYSNVLNAARIIAIVSPDAAPTKRMISAAKDKNLLIDASCGKKSQSVYIMDSGHIVLSAKANQGGV